jgi:hypothetical protein
MERSEKGSTMSFKFYCIHCRQHIEADVEHCGRKAACPTCDKPLIVPEAPNNETPLAASAANSDGPCASTEISAGSEREKQAQNSWANLFSGFGATMLSNLLLLTDWGKIPAVVLQLVGLFLYLSAPIYTVLDFIWYNKTRERGFLVNGLWGIAANTVVWPLLVIVNAKVLSQGSPQSPW